MRVLVTGHLGAIGSVTAEHLRAAGHEVVGFDLREGADLLDRRAVGEAAEGCAAVVHLAAIANDALGTPEQIMGVNVLGTWNVLLAAEAAGSERVVFFSSVQVLGIAEGESLPDYFPVDDAHPRRPRRAYGLSKVLGEDLCAAVTARSGLTTICLRPVAVWGPGRCERVLERQRADPEAEHRAVWEYGWYVEVADVAGAVRCALSPSVTGHVRALLSAPDTAGGRPSLEMVRRLGPGVPVRGEERYAADPWLGLVDCAVASEVLSWRPGRRFSEAAGRPSGR